MRKSIKIILICIIMIYMLINISFGTTGKLNIEASKVRLEPNTNSTVVTVIYRNDEVEIIDERDGWYKIKYSDYAGYVKKSFIDVKNEEENTVSISNTEEVVDNSNVSIYGTEDNKIDFIGADIILKEITNLKILPSFLSKNISQFEQGKVFTVREELNNWIQITDGITTGWILKIKAVDSASIPKANTNDIVNTTNTSKSEENTIKKDTNTSNTTNTSASESSINKTGYINVETANVREEPSKTSKIVYRLDLNDVINIISEQGEWYKITNTEIKEGYISKLLVTIK